MKSSLLDLAIVLGIGAAVSVWPNTAICQSALSAGKKPAAEQNSQSPWNLPRPPLLDGLEASVSASLDRVGAANLDIGVEVPPFHGIEPSIAVTYDSNAPDGMLGVGWRLSSPSTIQRLSRERGTPRYDSSDVMFLDGLELIPCNKTTPSPACRYAARNAPTFRYYFTRTESYRRIAFDTKTGHWSVWNSDGSRLDYDLAWLTLAARLPNRWMLTSRTDVFGNKVDYGYQGCDAAPATTSLNPAIVKIASANATGSPGLPSSALSWVNDANRFAPVKEVSRITPRNARLQLPRFMPEESVFFGGPAIPALSREEKSKPGARFAVDSELLKRIRSLRPGIRSTVPPGQTPSEDEEPIEPRLYAEAAWRPAPPDSAIGEAAGEVELSWLNRKDRLQPTMPEDMTVEYVYLKSIRYGRSAIDFHLEPRPDPVSFAIGDQTSVRLSCRLRAIDEHTDRDDGVPARVRAYTFQYEQREDTARSALLRVQGYGSDAELGPDGALVNAATATANPPITLKYPEPRHLDEFPTASQSLTPLPALGNKPVTSETFTMPLARTPDATEIGPLSQDVDINADGLPDQLFIYYRDPGNGDNTVVVQAYLAQPGGGFEQLDAYLPGIGRVFAQRTPIFFTVNTGDTDGDGRQEVIFVYDFSEPGETHLWLDAHVAVLRYDAESGFSTHKSGSLEWPISGQVHEWWLDAQGSGQEYIWNDPVQILVTDVNGDGLDDVLIVSNLAGPPDDATCKVSPDFCLGPVLKPRTWKLVTALSQGDGTFRRLPPVDTGWPIHGALVEWRKLFDGGRYYSPYPPKLTDEIWGVAGTNALYRPGREDRFVLSDFDHDGRMDIVKIGNTDPYGDERLEICSARPRTWRLDEIDAALFQLGCVQPALPPLDNSQHYIAGDVNGDGLTDLVRIFEYYPGRIRATKFLDLVPTSEGYAAIDFFRIDNGQVAFQALVSDGNQFVARGATYSNFRWPRNYRYGTDWRSDYWNLVNDFDSWRCVDIDGDSRCDVSMFAYPFNGKFLNVNDYFLKFAYDDVSEYAANPAIVQLVAFSTPSGDGTGVFFNTATYGGIGSHHRDKAHVDVVDLVDHNGDGRADVVTWTREAQNVQDGIRYYTMADRITLTGDFSHDVWKFVPSDFNGDGLTDLVRVTTHNTSLFVETAARQPGGELAPAFRWAIPDWPEVDGRTQRFQVTDIDGDGRDDLTLIRANGTQSVEAVVLLSKGDGSYAHSFSNISVTGAWRLEQGNWRALDVDGDGRTDLVHLSAVRTTVCPQGSGLRVDTFVAQSSLSFVHRQALLYPCDAIGKQVVNFVAADANGDGRGDLVGVFPSGTASDETVAYTLLSTGMGWHMVRSKVAGLDARIASSRWLTTDLNADRVADLHTLISEERGGRYDLFALRLRSNGDGSWYSSRTRIVRAFPTSDTLSWLSTDLNNDQRSDWLRVRLIDGGRAQVDTLTATSGAIPLRRTWNSTGAVGGSPDIARLRPVRSRGDGVDVLEALSWNTATGEYQFQRLGIEAASDRLAAIRDGLGGTTDLTYRTTAENKTVTASAECRLPASLSLSFVTLIKRGDGRGAPVDTQYEYSCPKWSNLQRRTLGFAQLIATESAVANRPTRTTTRTAQLNEECERQELSVESRDPSNVYGWTRWSYPSPGSAPPFFCQPTRIEQGQHAVDGSDATSGQRIVYSEMGEPEWIFDDGDPLAKVMSLVN